MKKAVIILAIVFIIECAFISARIDFPKMSEKQSYVMSIVKTKVSKCDFIAEKIVFYK